jgi:hypothetical protein
MRWSEDNPAFKGGQDHLAFYGIDYTSSRSFSLNMVIAQDLDYTSQEARISP